MKGIILAGGKGTRLAPLTHLFSKQMLPVYDKPMIYYPLSTLMLAGIREIAIISTPKDLPWFEQLLGDGSSWGLKLSYIVQPNPEGLPQAFTLSEAFLNGDSCCLILGDNLFYSEGLTALLQESRKKIENGSGARIFGYKVKNPSDYGVVEFDKFHQVISLEEKPVDPKSSHAVVGIYFCDGSAPKRSSALKPSKRGELEIVDLLHSYREESKLTVELLGRGIAWLDTGTHDSLSRATQFVSTIQERQGLKICCPEEIAYRSGWIHRKQLTELAVKCGASDYGDYLQSLLDEVY